MTMIVMVVVVVTVVVAVVVGSWLVATSTGLCDCILLGFK